MESVPRHSPRSPVDEVVVSAAGVCRTFGRGQSERRALVDVGFEVRHGRTLAVIGESGAGKTTLVRLIAGLDKPTVGTIEVGGAPPRIRQGVPSPVQIVFQQPLEALNPFHSIGRSVGEPLQSLARKERTKRVHQLLDSVGISPSRTEDRPGRFSGGQLQRIVIARALAAEPKVLLCDEPTSSLDVSVQAQIINLLMELQSAMNFTSILVTHDLAVAKVLSDDVLVLKSGEVVEYAAAESFFKRPSHDYSRHLLSMTIEPVIGSRAGRREPATWSS